MNREITIKYEDIELELHGVYTAGSDAVFYYSDMSGHPGDSPEFEIHAVYHEGVDIINIIHDVVFEELEVKALDYIE